MHAFHVFDENNIKSAKDLMDIIGSHSKEEQIGFINDFEIPYINLKMRYPKLKKKKKKSSGDDDDSDGQDGEEEDDDEDNNEDDEDKEDDEEDDDDS